MFKDRAEAGRLLAERLTRFKDKQPVILALPRGGVTVGFEISQRLGAPLDVVLVRKIGAPMQPELAIGAIADGEHPEMVLNQEVVELFDLPKSYLIEARDQQLEEIERRRAIYIGSRPRPPIAGSTAIVVDDVIATGATARAALLAVRRARPSRLVLAVPVAAPETIAKLRRDVDEIECLEMPSDLMAIGLHYKNFQQVTDDEVIEMLAKAAQMTDVANRHSKTRNGVKG